MRTNVKLFLTQDTSGAPLVRCGNVVAVNNAGTVNLIISIDEDGNVILDRQAAAANNFGIHVKHLQDLIASVEGGLVTAEPLPPPDPEPEPQPEPEPEPIFVAGDLFSFLTPEETDYFQQRVAAVNLDIDSQIEIELSVIQMDLIDHGLWCSSLYLNALCGAQKDSVSLKRQATWSILEEVASVFGFSLYPLSVEKLLEIDAFNCQEYPGGSVTIEHCGLSMTCVVDESC